MFYSHLPLLCNYAITIDGNIRNILKMCSAMF